MLVDVGTTSEMNERRDPIRTGNARARTLALKLVVSGVAGATLLAVAGGSTTGARAADMTAGATQATSITRLAAAAVSLWSSGTSPRTAGTPSVRHVAAAAPARPAAVGSTLAVIAPPRNRLIGPGLDAGVSTYSDCTGRTPLPRHAVAIDVCVTRNTYFVGHSFGGPFTGLTHAFNGETLTWYDADGVAHRYTIEGRQYTRAYGPADIPPPGTTAQFQTCLTRGGSRIVTYFAVSR